MLRIFILRCKSVSVDAGSSSGHPHHHPQGCQHAVTIQPVSLNFQEYLNRSSTLDFLSSADTSGQTCYRCRRQTTYRCRRLRHRWSRQSSTKNTRSSTIADRAMLPIIEYFAMSLKVARGHSN